MADIAGLLLAVVGQNLVAGFGQLGSVLLQAVQNDKVVLIHHRAAEFLNVVGTGLLLFRRSAVLLLLGHGSGRDRQRQQSSYQESFTHCVPLFLRQRFRTRLALGVGRQTTQPATAAKALANAAKFAATVSLNCGPRKRISTST